MQDEADALDTPWRDNHEGHALLAWCLAACLGIPYLLIESDSPWPTVLWLGLMLMGALRRVPAAWARQQLKRRLEVLPDPWIDREALKAKLRTQPHSLYLGSGFDWGPKEAQWAHERMRAPRVSPPDPRALGANWIHGLSPREADLFQPLRHGEGHTLIVGTTGAGKSRTFDLLLTQAVLRDETVLIMDPKGDQDLRNAAQTACQMAGHADRFVYFHPGFPEHSVRINPLRNFTRASEIAARIAQIMPSQGPNDPFKAFGQQSIDHLVKGLLAIETRPTLLGLRRLLEGGPSELVVRALDRHFHRVIGPHWASQARASGLRGESFHAPMMLKLYRERVARQHPAPDLEGLFALYEHDAAHFSKMVASLLPLMNMLTSGSLAGLLSPDPDDLEDPRPMTDLSALLRRKAVIYLGLDTLSDSAVGSAIGSMVLADLASIAGDRYNFDGTHAPVNLFIDEAAEIINDPCIQLLNKGRGAGIRLTIATQTFADFEARLGSTAKARQVLANVNNLIALRVLDSETQRYITDNLPAIHFRRLEQAHGITTRGEAALDYSGTLSQQLRSENADRFPPALMSHLPDLHFIAKLAGGRIIKGRIPLIRSEALP